MMRSTRTILAAWGIIAYAVTLFVVVEFALKAEERERQLQEQIESDAQRISELEKQIVVLSAPRLPIDEAFLLWPILEEDYKHMSSPIGRRRSPVYGGQYRFHRGMDIVGVEKARIVAAATGIITDVYPHPHGKWAGHKTKGGYVEIAHPGGWVTRYSHLSVVYEEWWKIGTVIKAGDIIGRQGNTGLSIDDHLHFELLKDGVHKNPLKYLEDR